MKVGPQVSNRPSVDVNVCWTLVVKLKPLSICIADKGWILHDLIDDNLCAGDVYGNCHQERNDDGECHLVGPHGLPPDLNDE
jgi:hypothetical protein